MLRAARHIVNRVGSCKGQPFQANCKPCVDGISQQLVTGAKLVGGMGLVGVGWHNRDMFVPVMAEYGVCNDMFVMGRWDQCKDLKLHPSILTFELVRAKGFELSDENLMNVPESVLQNNIDNVNIRHLLMHRKLSSNIGGVLGALMQQGYAEDVVRTQDLSEQFMSHYKDYFSWDLLCRHQTMSKQFKIQHLEKIAAINLACLGEIPEDELRRLTDEQMLGYLRLHIGDQKFPCEFLEQHWDKIKGFDSVAENQDLTERFMNLHKDELDWAILTRHQKMTWNFRERFKDRIDWGYLISSGQMKGQLARLFVLCPDRLNLIGNEDELKKLPEDVVSQYVRWIPINELAKHREFSEEFVARHLGGALDPMVAGKHQWKSLTNDQIWRYGSRMDMAQLSRTKKLSERILTKYIDQLDLVWLIRNRKLSEKFIGKHIQKLDMEYLSYHKKFSEGFRAKYGRYIDYNDNYLYMELAERMERMKGLSSQERDRVMKILKRQGVMKKDMGEFFNGLGMRVEIEGEYVRFRVRDIKDVCGKSRNRLGDLRYYDATGPVVPCENGHRIRVYYEDVTWIDSDRLQCTKVYIDY